MNYTQLLEDVKSEVTQFFEDAEKKTLPYHNLAHTAYVASKAGEIAMHYELGDKEFFIVVASAWFHDTGYLNGLVTDHESRSAELAGIFLRTKGLDEASIQQVKNCIMATSMPQNPHNLLEEIVCDADLYHLGTEMFDDCNKKMRKEASILLDKKISKDAWRNATISLLESHNYRTDYVRNLLSEKKAENISGIKGKVMETDELGSISESLPPSLTVSEIEKPVKKKGKKKKEKSQRPDRGIETMFRISATNHQRLSDMADNKSNIMITTTSIILSILLSLLLRKLDDNQHLVIPAVMLLTVCVVTMVFSILATRPSIPDGRFTKEDIDAKKTNLLFFGNFYRMSYDDYQEGMKAMMIDREFLYGSLTLDVYSQGIVLGRKYRLLRSGYNVFMYGIIASVLAFVIAAVTTMH